MKSAKAAPRKAVRRVVSRVPKTLPDEPMPGERSIFNMHQARKKERMLEALEKHMGVVLYAIKEVGIARKTHYNWMTDDPDYAEKVEDINEGTGDFVERKLLEAIQEKQPAVMIFVAKTKWKQRGYVERHEVSGPNGGEIKVGGYLGVSQAMQELPPEGIESILQKMTGGGGKAEEALKRLRGLHTDQVAHSASKE